MKYNLINFFKFQKNYGLGLFFFVNRQYFKSIYYFQKSINYAKNDFDSNKYLGIAYWLEKKCPQAKQYLLEAERIRNSKFSKLVDSELFFFLGNLYDAEANLKKAKEYYQLAIKHFKNLDLYTNIDFINSRLVKIDEWYRKNPGQEPSPLPLK